MSCVMSRVNDVTLFSNGIGHFRRVYVVRVDQDEKISIPFKRDNIGDVAASLQIFGKVKIVTPPSFTPSNSNATSLVISQDEALKSLLRGLSGSEILLKQNNMVITECKLLGLDIETYQSNQTSIDKDFIIILDNYDNVKRFALTDITGVEFTEESVKTEIQKALKNNFQRIKPDSTLLDISLTTLEGETEEKDAIIQYTIPVAAWKMRYAIRQEGDKFSIEGAAIIDNNTDEDWDNFRISVVTGNPISFSTDIANVVVPTRKMIRLVDTNTLSNVDVQEGYAESGLEAVYSPAVATRSMGARSMSPKSSVANYASFGLESGGTFDCSSDMIAEAPGVDSKDVGDFCIFTAKEPMTILARKSAIVPMFSVPLSKAGVLLLYKESSNSRRPYRAVKFVNETPYSLGRGKTIIYNDGVFSGECVLENTKPGENRMLPHCLENGVKIVKELKSSEARNNSISVSKNVIINNYLYTAKTAYVVENKKDESFKLAIEHSNQISRTNVEVNFEGAEIVEKERLVDGNGYRIYLNLKPKESLTITVTEKHLEASSITINGFKSFQSSIGDIYKDVCEDKNVKAAIDIQKEIDDLAVTSSDVDVRRKELEAQVNRIRQNVSATQSVANNSTVATWVKDLDDSEKEIRSLDEKLSKIRIDNKNLLSKMSYALQSIVFDWKLKD